MKIKVNNVFNCIFLFCSAFIFSSCIGLKTKWESVDTATLVLQYDETASTTGPKFEIINDRSEGEIFVQYSLWDKSITQENINNCSVKNLGYNICGFEGKLKFGDGPVSEYGFIFNVDLDKNSYYLLSLTRNGSINLYFYDGKASPKGHLEPLIVEIHASEAGNPTKGKTVNTVKVETGSNGTVGVYVNNKQIYTIIDPVNPRGTIGVFQMLYEPEKGFFSRSNPMVSLFSISRVQRY